ncbi:MAG TPA: TIGR04282 family arsenosugar biosynthesis glycosyltransferase [Burkholderiales bacterium]|nr:TIGR04282 family arsenosugar biosynthesis glycosyltransferase [Burkholderiales bacterium]
MPSIADSIVIVFARAPRAGAAKTRLMPRLGAEGAARLQKRLIQAALRTAAGSGDVQLHVTRSHAWFRTLGVPVRMQRGADLGARMHHALRVAVRRHRAVVLIGNDAPSLRTTDLDQAVRWLRGGADIVLAPAEDGGYALIGARRIDARVFHGVRWGGPDVLAQTLRNAERCGLECRLLRTVWDVDRPEDLERLRALRFSSASRRGARRSRRSRGHSDGSGRT